ncbi:cue family protein [Megaselia abdita]
MTLGFHAVVYGIRSKNIEGKLYECDLQEPNILLFCVLWFVCMKFAVTTQTKIEFFDDSWSPVYTAAHQFDELSSLSFDETSEKIYFNDRLNGSIFSVRLSPTTSASDEIENVVISNTTNENILGLAVDPLEQMIYWTDSNNKKIYRKFMSASGPVEVVHDFTNDPTIPDGIAIDVCRRKLYWTNSNHTSASIERSNLNGEKRETLINSKLFLPHGIVVDQFENKIYWVVDQEGIHFSVESADLDGSNRLVLIEGLHNVPHNLAVTREKIFWTDLIRKSVWSAGKFAKSEEATLVKSFAGKPKGIITRLGFLSNLSNHKECKEVISMIKTRIESMSSGSTMSPHAQVRKEIFCMNGGEYSAFSGGCVCKVGFKGLRCETNECHNYCVHGTCSVNEMGFPKCLCQQGFYGERCSNYQCADHCLNDGKCRLEEDFFAQELKPHCDCTGNFIGLRCEFNATEMCSVFCKLLEYNPESEVPFGCHDICETLNIVDKQLITSSAAKYLKQIDECNTNFNLTIVFVVCGLLVALVLVFGIVKAVKRFYKISRPKIKKTFVVKKNYTQTPLTSRPLAAEQCEITIENCCNMNICDTPCFDPKLLQQSLDSKTKEDKKMLLNNMDGDLY